MEVNFSKEFEKSMNRAIWHERLAFINPAEWYRSVKWFIQRGRRGYSDCDLWNANDHIARTVLAFFDNVEKTGIPMGVSEKQWEYYQTEIRWLMNEHIHNDTHIAVIKTEAYKKRYAKAQWIFGTYWQALWD